MTSETPVISPGHFDTEFSDTVELDNNLNHCCCFPNRHSIRSALTHDVARIKAEMDDAAAIDHRRGQICLVLDEIADPNLHRSNVA